MFVYLNENAMVVLAVILLVMTTILTVRSRRNVRARDWHPLPAMLPWLVTMSIVNCAIGVGIFWFVRTLLMQLLTQIFETDSLGISVVATLLSMCVASLMTMRVHAQYLLGPEPRKEPAHENTPSD